jgi:hypothetical protein
LYAVGISAFLIAFFIFAFQSRRAGDPATLALKKLSLIDSVDSTPRQSIHDVYDVVRSYLMERYKIPASTKPTPELLAEPGLRAKLSTGRQQMLADFLESADCLRFPQPEPTRDQLEVCLGRARGFLASENP